MELSDIYQKASLVQIPSGYKSGTLYSVVPNTSSGDFTVTGDPQGEATRVNKDGLIESVAANVPRLNYDLTNPQNPHLLLEPTRTNSLTYSEDFTGSNWFIQNSATLIANNVVAPDGTLTASTLQNADGTSISGNVLQKNITFSSDCVTSIYIKSLGSTTVALCSRTANGSQTFTSYNISGNEWKRFDRFINASSSALNQFSIGGTNGDIAVWGAQVEAGSYPTSYIPTSGNAVTRTLDKCLNAGSSNLFNNAEGTLFVDLENFDAEARELTLSNGFADKRITFLFYGSTFGVPNKIRFFVANGTTQVDSSTILSYNFNQRNKIAFRYKQNDFKAYINGTQVFVDTSGTTPTSLSRFDFASFNGTTGFIEGEIHQAMVFNEALSDTELETITSYRSFNEMAKALLYTIE